MNFNEILSSAKFEYYSNTNYESPMTVNQSQEFHTEINSVDDNILSTDFVTNDVDILQFNSEVNTVYILFNCVYYINNFLYFWYSDTRRI